MKQARSRAARKTPARRAATPPVVDAPPEVFQRQEKRYTLDFIGEWAGMIVSFRPLPFRYVVENAVTLDWASGDSSRDEWQAGMLATARAAAVALESWNVVDRTGQPVPATYEGLCSLDQDQAIAIIMAWAFRVIGVSAPLGERSPSGATSEEASIPMATSSPSLAS